MGLFHKKSSTPPPPATEPSYPRPGDTTAPHDSNMNNSQLPIHNTGSSYTPVSEVPAPQYTPNSNNHGIEPVAAGGVNNGQAYNEKSAGINHTPGQTGYVHDPNQSQQHIYNQDPALNNSQHYPAGTQSHPDFHTHDKTQQQQQYNNGQPQQQFYQQQNGPGRNNYQSSTPLRSLQQGPEVVDCPVCGVRDLTRTEFTSGGTTHASALLCCLCLCLGCIPYMATWFKDCEHSCGNCGSLLAVWHRSGHTEVFGKGRVTGPPNGAQQGPGGPGVNGQQQQKFT